MQLHQHLTREVFLSLCPPEGGSGVESSWDFQLCVSDKPEDEFFQNLTSSMVPRVPILPQAGEDLGERMSNAFLQTLGSYQFVIIVGSDCPFLSAAHMDMLFQWLKQGSDCVLIPAQDGGYVAIGCRRHLPELFCGVEWGTDRVFQQTLTRLEQSSITYQYAQPLADIDRPEDLRLCPGLSRFALLAEG